MDQLSLDLTSAAPRDPATGVPQPPPAPRETGPRLADPARIVLSLAEALEGPPRRTFLVGRTRGEGRELLRQLGLRGRSWVGVEPTTLRPIALEILGSELASAGRRVLDDLEQEALVEASLDGALAELPSSPWESLAEGVGFRGAVASTVAALRLGGIRSPQVASSAIRDPHRRGLVAAILRKYEEGLQGARAVDTAALFHRAARRLEAEPGALDGRVLFLPGIPARGLAGRFVRGLLTAGARVLPADAVGLPVQEGGLVWAEAPATGAPEIRAFRAAGVADEVREVLRRVLQEGVPFDQVEVVTADPVTYGSAFHVEGSTLGVPISFGVGLPVERTRPGRVAIAWFRWLDGGFSADLLRGLLEAGDLEPPRDEGLPDGPRLARRLRLLRVGWGWERYRTLVESAQRGADGAPLLREEESPGERDDRQRRTREELDGLRRFLVPVMESIPEPLRVGRGRDVTSGLVSPGQAARALRSFLEWVRPGTGPDSTALQRLQQQLDRIAATLVRPTDPAAALRILRRHLRIRVPAPDALGAAPWMASGGFLHVTDVEHGGFTGRPVTFVVGMDADRFAPRITADPLLPDQDRRLLDPRLQTGADRARESTFRLAAFLARLRGRVTVSYAAWSTGEARELSPSPLLLEQVRRMTGRRGLGYDDLPGVLGPVRGRVPAPASPVLDADDVWLRALSAGPGVLKEGRRGVLAGRPALAAGVLARGCWGEDLVSAHHGRLRPRPELDPRLDPGLVVSPSSLEALGTCGLRYLYRAGLKIRPPSDLDFDPDLWLDPLHRGSLLHRVFERTLREARAEDVPPADEAALSRLAARILQDEARREEREVPPPGEGVRLREMAGLASDVQAFVHQVVRDGAPWEELELRFGPEAGRPVRVSVPGGQIGLRGAVDRVDRGGAGLVVVDYKTGSASRYGPENGTFHGGRRLQHILYVLAVEQLKDEPVESMVYLFPGRTGKNDRKAFSRKALVAGEELVGALLDLVREGRFLPSENVNDCLSCDFNTICRVREERWSTLSPPAAWAAERMATEPELLPLRRIRQWEGS